MRQIKASGGYTLIELLLYVVIIGSLLGVLTMFLGLSLQSGVKSQSITEVNQQGAKAMDYILDTIRNATSITAPTSGTSASSLTLVIPNAAQSPTIISLSSTTLQAKEGSAAALPLTNSKVAVTSLSFTHVGRTGTDGAIRIIMTLQRVNTSGRNEYAYVKTFTSTAALR